MKLAYVKGGVVQTTLPGTDKSRYPDLLEWLIECSDEVRDNWTYDGSTFSPPVEIPPP